MEDVKGSIIPAGEGEGEGEGGSGGWGWAEKGWGVGSGLSETSIMSRIHRLLRGGSEVIGLGAGGRGHEPQGKI